MPEAPFISFEEFNELSSDAKREFIQNNLTLKHLGTSGLGAQYLTQVTINSNKWQPLTAKTKLAIMQYIFSTEQFDVSGGFMQCFSRDFFGYFVVNGVVKEVFESSEDSVVRDFLYTLATNHAFMTAIPPRSELVESNDKEILKSMLLRSFGRFDKDITVLEAAANSLNANFIIMLLELRQDLNVMPTSFRQDIEKACITISANLGYKYEDRQSKLIEIKQWLKKNNAAGSLTEEYLLHKLEPLIDLKTDLEQEEPKSDKVPGSKKLKKHFSA